MKCIHLQRFRLHLNQIVQWDRSGSRTFYRLSQFDSCRIWILSSVLPSKCAECVTHLDRNSSLSRLCQMRLNDVTHQPLHASLSYPHLYHYAFTSGEKRNSELNIFSSQMLIQLLCVRLHKLWQNCTITNWLIKNKNAIHTWWKALLYILYFIKRRYTFIFLRLMWL